VAFETHQNIHEVTFSLTGGIHLLPDEQNLSSWAKC